MFLENAHIRAYFESADYRRTVPDMFALPARPMVRVSVLDFYRMENGPTYRESEVSVLVLYEGKPGWFVLTMPVTDRDACSAGRNALGTPKVMRRVTLEGLTGVSYARGGREAEFTLKLLPAEPGEAIRAFAALPDYTLLNGRVLEIRGGGEAVEVRGGEPRIETAPQSVARRVGIGKPVGGYWARVRGRFNITPTPAR